MGFCGRGGSRSPCCRPCLKEFIVKFGRDFFKILSLVIQIMRLFASVMGDEEDKREVEASEDRSASSNVGEVC